MTALAGPRRLGRRMLRLWTWLLTWPLLCATQSFAIAAAPFEIKPPQAWVDVVTPDLATVVPAEQLSGGVHYLLHDQQVRVQGNTRVAYRHVAMRALSSRGVESTANVEIRFDPAYQRLVLHNIAVRRGTQLLPRLKASDVRVLQREAELESLIFDGRRTASVFVDDVRVGDVVEYAYSLHGVNPVFDQRHFGHFEMQWGVPVARARARLLWPAGRELQLRPFNGLGEPQRRTLGGATELVWERLAVPALVVENDAPAWFDPYPGVSWGEYKDWAAVARWAAPLYRVPARLSPALQTEVSRIAAAHADAPGRLLATLQWVQREVRYLGIEIGPASHAPHAPERVLERRFGDCKDKTLLMVVMLRALGMTAQPALVNTQVQAGIQGWLPSPAAFNHVLVRAQMGGEVFWLDPTRAPQWGPLAKVAQADYGKALVVDDSSTALVDMAGEQALLTYREVHTLIDASDGVDKPARLTVTTTVEGLAADGLRASLAANSHDSVQKQYVNFYSGHFDDVSATAALEVHDDLQANRLQVVERYRVGQFWKRAEARRRFEGRLAFPELMDAIREPSKPVRSSPLALKHPTSLLAVTEVLLPGRWSLKPDPLRIDDPAFAFERKEEVHDSRIVLTDRLQSRQREVAAADVARYTANVAKLRADTSYTLYQYDQAADATADSGAPHWLPAVLATLTLVGLGGLVLRLYRWDPPAMPGALDPLAPRGLGGWLILAGFGLVAGLFRLVNTVMQSLPAYGAQRWLELTVSGATHYHAMWAPLLIFELVANLCLVAVTSLVLVLFFRRRSSAPRVLIALMVSGFVVALLDTLMASAVPSPTPDQTSSGLTALFWQGLSTAIWWAYFVRSQRVRATFVQRLRASEEPPAQ